MSLNKYGTILFSLHKLKIIDVIASSSDVAM